MAKSVGPVNIKVGVNAAGAYAELGKVERRMKQTANVAKKQSALTRLGASAIGQGGKAFGGGLLGAIPGISTALGGPVAIGTALAAALTASTVAAAAHIDAQGKLADRLNLSTEALEGLTHAAELSGVSGEQLTSALSMLQRNLGKAALGEQLQVESLARLGLTYQQIAGLSMDQQFALIADRLNAIPDAAERAAVTTELFGRAGQQLAPLLAEGSEGLAAMQQEAEKLGLTFSREEAAKVEEMNDNWSRLTKSFTGLSTQLTVTLAPALAEIFLAVADAAASMTSMVRVAREFANLRFTGTANQMSLLFRGLSMFDRTGVLTNIANQFSAAAAAQNVPSGPEGAIVTALARLDTNIVRAIEGLQRSLETELATALGGDPLALELIRIQEQVRVQQDAIWNAMQQNVQGLQNLAAPFGAPALQVVQPLIQAQIDLAQKQIANLQKQFTLQAEATKKMNEQLQLVRQRNALEQQATQIVQQMQSPLEVFNQRLGQITQLSNRGLLSQNVSTLATAQAFQQLADSLPQASQVGPEALQAGSIAAQAAINRFNRQGGAANIQQQVRDIVRQQLEIQRRQLEVARETSRAIQGLGPIAPAGLAP